MLHSEELVKKWVDVAFSLNLLILYANKKLIPLAGKGLCEKNRGGETQIFVLRVKQSDKNELKAWTTRQFSPRGIWQAFK